MHDQFSNAQQFRKPAAVSKGGIVAAQSRRAAEVGAQVLAAQEETAWTRWSRPLSR
jgi:gamma-glutamyltranspeptidase/glutathione hydrolase